MENSADSALLPILADHTGTSDPAFLVLQQGCRRNANAKDINSLGTTSFKKRPVRGGLHHEYRVEAAAA